MKGSSDLAEALVEERDNTVEKVQLFPGSFLGGFNFTKCGVLDAEGEVNQSKQLCRERQWM